MEYIQQDLTQLNMSYVDLMLLHAPCQDDASAVAVWQAMELALKNNL